MLVMTLMWFWLGQGNKGDHPLPRAALKDLDWLDAPCLSDPQD